MSKIYPSLTLLILALSGLVGCDYESRAAVNTNSIRLVKMKQSFRDLWLGHIYWVQRSISNSVPNNLAERNAADREVVANAQQMANTVTPFYGEASSEQLFALLVGHYAAIKEYAEATVAGHTGRQDATLARLASNANDIDVFFNGVNPSYLPKGIVGGLIEVHDAHQVLQINQYKKREYAELEETWPMMRQHVYQIADTLTRALAKQFPDKFS